MRTLALCLGTIHEGMLSAGGADDLTGAFALNLTGAFALPLAASGSTGGGQTTMLKRWSAIATRRILAAIFGRAPALVPIPVRTTVPPQRRQR